MNVDVLFAAVPVTDLETSLAWYRGLFGRAPDIVPNDDEVMWQVANGGWVYVLHDTERAGRTVVTMSVADLDGSLAELAARGLQGGPIEIIGDAGRKAVLTDPDGNQVAIIEVTARAPES